jgi:hypothetical protein
VRWLAATIALVLTLGCTPGVGTDDDAWIDQDAALDPSCDHDHDGFASSACRGDDCDDADPTRHRSATELCNEIDDDCDHRVDEGLLPAVYYVDVDHDGYAGGRGTSTVCPPAGVAAEPNDCDENDARVHPGAHDGAPDGCNGIDDDCNGIPDDECACTAPAMEACGALDPSDPSGATFMTQGVCRMGTQPCGSAGHWDACIGAVFPDREQCTESGPGLDEDCDGRIDESGPSLTCACPAYAGGWDPSTVVVTRGAPTSALGLVLTLIDATSASGGTPASADVAVACSSTTADEGTLHVDTATSVESWTLSPNCSVRVVLVDADADHATLTFAFALCG